MDSACLRELKKAKKQNKERNKLYGTEQLVKAGYTFSSHNHGLHLVIVHESCTIDYWPSTGKWKDRTSPIYHRGLSNLLSYLEA
ncbi:MAG: hypothetical protein DRJ64_08330 [Thermoprotei archaeon]|nr:MAG: hypothetical protein DRJ64_08330 [Thermoprotei archaeon]